MSSAGRILRTFPNDPIPQAISHGEGLYLHTQKGDRFLDLTSGFTGHSVLGWGNKRIINSIAEQLNKIGHIDYKSYLDPNREELASLMLSSTNHGLDRLFLCGGSGGEACEAAIHLSYQVHCENGNPEKAQDRKSVV